MAFTSYVTTSEFKKWVVLNDAIDDAVITDVGESVTRWIDEYCNRHFWTDGVTGTEVARTFTPCHPYQLDIDDLVSVTAFKTDEAGDGTYETTWSATDYQLQPVNRPNGQPYTNVEAVAARIFPIRSGRASRANRVEITGIWGWAQVPDAIQQACLIQASKVLNRRYSPQGVAGFGDFGVVRVSMKLDPQVEELLYPYRRRPVLVA